jgi:acetoacetyl-CoA reductase
MFLVGVLRSRPSRRRVQHSGLERSNRLTARRGKLLEQIPMRRFGRPDEVARACVYLCSPDGDYITGSELKINGGLYM